MSRDELIASFRDTMNLTKTDEFIRDETERAVRNTFVYREGFRSWNKNVKSETPYISVTPNSTFGEAFLHRNEGKRIAVLNFANGSHPGGGVKRGAVAQEECLCRSSNLYRALETKRLHREYYNHNSIMHSLLSTDRIVYTKDVLVFKNEDFIPEMLDRKDFFNVDVITCAAPINKIMQAGDEDDTLREIFTSRIEAILKCASDNDVDILILGAFGCGAFANPPELVSEVFSKLLVDKGYFRYFEKVIFAVLKKEGERSANYDVFMNTLG